MFPLDEVLDLVLMTDVAAPTDDRDGLHDSVDSGEQETKVGHCTA